MWISERKIIGIGIYNSVTHSQKTLFRIIYVFERIFKIENRALKSFETKADHAFNCFSFHFGRFE